MKTTLHLFLQATENDVPWQCVPGLSSGPLEELCTDEQSYIWKKLGGEERDGKVVPKPLDEVNHLSDRLKHICKERSRTTHHLWKVEPIDPLHFKITIRSRKSEEPPVIDEGVKAELEARDTGRWSYDRITCCTTGKDADLSDWGQQGVEYLGFKGGLHHCIAHIGSSFAGIDVCLNLPEWAENDDEVYERCRDQFVEQMEGVVCGCSVPGEWTGDDWYLSDEIRFRVKPRASDAETATAILQKLDRVLKNSEEELRLANEIGNQIAGWRDANGKPVPVGTVSEGACFRFILDEARPGWEKEGGDDNE